MEKLSRLPDFVNWVETLRVPLYAENEKWSQTARFVRAGMVFLALFTLLILGSVLSGRVFLGLRNLRNIFSFLIPTLLAAMVMVYLYRQGGLDLSFMAVGALSGMVMALMIEKTQSLSLGLASGFGVAFLFGLSNSFMTGLIRVPGILATLVSSMSAFGLTLAFSQGRTVMLILSEPQRMLMGLFFRGFGWILILSLLVFLVALSHFSTLFGKKKESPEPTGGFVKILKIGLPYLFSSLIAGFAGMTQTYFMSAGTVGQGSNGWLDLLFVIFAGGALYGCRQSNPLGVFLAALVLGFLRNLTSVLGVNYFNTLILISFLAGLALIINFVYDLIVSYFYSQKQKA